MEALVEERLEGPLPEAGVILQEDVLPCLLLAGNRRFDDALTADGDLRVLLALEETEVLRQLVAEFRNHLNVYPIGDQIRVDEAVVDDNVLHGFSTD